MTSGSKRAKIVSIGNQDGCNGSAPLNKMATRAKNRKSSNDILSLANSPISNQIICTEVFLQWPSTKLLKWFCLAEQNGGQSKKYKNF